MRRHFFIGPDLADLERLEEELERAGLARSQIHLLTLDFTGASRHRHLNPVSALMQLNLVRGGFIGAGVGVCVAMLVLGVAHAAGWTQAAAGWVPFTFLAIIAFGFSTWEGGFLGIQTPSAHVRRFEAALKTGRHVFFVDVDEAQADTLARCLLSHPAVEAAGTEARNAGLNRLLTALAGRRLPGFGSEAEPREKGGVALYRHQPHQEHEQPRR